MSQTGRPNDGTDPTSFFNIEFHVDLKPKEEWKRDITKIQAHRFHAGKICRVSGHIFQFLAADHG
jgi:cobalt-zinc-cadmium resistance protein CzcA